MSKLSEPPVFMSLACRVTVRRLQRREVRRANGRPRGRQLGAPDGLDQLGGRDGARAHAHVDPDRPTLAPPPLTPHPK